MRRQFYKTIFIVCCWIIGTRSQEDTCIDMQSQELLKSTSQYITGEIQALVPAMRFNCSGKITSWNLGVHSFNISVESIQLQVWRYISDGVYRLMGSNSVLHNQIETPKIVTQNVPTNEQISFTIGDIIGFSINTVDYRLLLDSPSNNSNILYIPSVPGKQLCTINTTCVEIIQIKRNFLPQLQVHYEMIADSINNNSATEVCTEWSEIYNNCQMKSPGTVESTVSDQRPTETSGDTDDRGVVTNTADTSTSKGSSDRMPVIVGTIIGGIIFIFLLMVVILMTIVCLRKRHLHKRSNHLINGPVAVPELKSVFPDYYKPYQNKALVTNCYSEEKIINHLVHGTKLNNEKENNDFSEADYVVMTSCMPPSTDTYEKMCKNPALPVIEEKYEIMVGQSQPEILEEAEETKHEVEKETKEIEKEIEANISDEDKTMSEAITRWMDSTQIPRISKQNIKVLTQVRRSINTMVYKGILDLGKGKQEVAVRQLKTGVQKADTIRFMQEVAILTQIHHPSIVQFHGMVENENPRMAVLEFGSHGNLDEFLEEQTEITRQSGTISDELHELFKTFSNQIARGMNYVHNKGYAHGNLETKHIIITSQNQCKITGLSVICSACPRDMMSYLPSSSKMVLPPPEVAEDGRFMKESDIWSFGTILYFMWGTGHKPHEKLETAYNEMLYSGNHLSKNVIPQIPNSLPIINKIVEECWKLNPTKRPTFSSLVTWISELDSDYTDV